MKNKEIANEISSHEKHIVADILGVSGVLVNKVLDGSRNNERVLTACEQILILRKDMILQLSKQMESIASNNKLMNKE